MRNKAPGVAEEDRQVGVIAVTRALSLMEAFRVGESTLSLAELSRRAGMHKTTALRLARTLALSPEVVLFDEPTTGLDPVSARRIDRLIREVAKTLGVTCIVVSHDPPSIFGIADRVAFIYQGVVHVVATPAELRASPDPIVQQFINGQSTGPMETPGF